MVHGVFDSDDNHLFTYEYGDSETTAKRMSKNLGEDYYARELTSDEYWERMKDIYILGKYNT